MNMNMNII